MMSYMEIATYLGMLNLILSAIPFEGDDLGVNDKMRQALLEAQLLITNFAIEQAKEEISNVHD